MDKASTNGGELTRRDVLKTTGQIAAASALAGLAIPQHVYAGENGTVSMRVDLAPTGRLSIRLSNSGAAVPEEIKQNLFTPFFSSRQAGRAPGLGLPLAWRLLDSIGAKLTLESDGKDTPVCWKVEMPLMNISISTRDIPESQPVRHAA